MISARPSTPESGRPAAIDLAKTTRSGSIPKCSMAKNVPCDRPPSEPRRRPGRCRSRHRSFEAFDELALRDDEAALALYRLEHDRRDLLDRDLRLEGALDGVEVVERHPVDLRSERAEAGLVRVRLRREAESEQRPSVEAALEADDRRTASVRARELDRVLDRLSPRVEEPGSRLARDGRERREPLGESDVILIGDDREVGVGEAPGLFLDRLDDPRVRVADVQAADAAGEVDERVAVHVGERRAAALGHDELAVDGQRLGDHTLFPLQDLAAAGAWNLGSELDGPGRGHGRGAYRLTPAMVLSDRTIRRLVGEGHIGIDPFDETLVQPSSVDVRVDRYFRVFHNSRHPFIDVKEPMDDLTELVEVNSRPSSSTRASSCSVRRSSASRCPTICRAAGGQELLGRLGLLIHSTAGFIDPGWDGHVTLELSNVANLPITIYVGMRSGSSRSCSSEPAEEPYGSDALGSKYQGQSGPTPSRYWKNFE